MSADDVWERRGLSTAGQFHRADELTRLIVRPGIRIADARDAAARLVLTLVSPADDMAAEVRRLLDKLTHDPRALQYAYGSTTTKRVLDLAMELEAALNAYEFKGSDA